MDRILAVDDDKGILEVLRLAGNDTLCHNLFMVSFL